MAAITTVWYISDILLHAPEAPNLRKQGADICFVTNCQNTVKNELEGGIF